MKINYINNIAQYFCARGKNGDEVPCAYFLYSEKKKCKKNKIHKKTFTRVKNTRK